MRARAASLGTAAVALLALALAGAPSASAQNVYVDVGSANRWLANATDPGIGMTWVDPAFDDSAWTAGTYGIGYETDSGVEDLAATVVPSTSDSVFTRTRFQVADARDVRALYLGLDYDDGVAVWLNGQEIYRSPEMPMGQLFWETRAASHESSNGSVPTLVPLIDLGPSAAAAVRTGENVLAVGVWNSGTGSTDLLVVPRLIGDVPLMVSRGPYLQVMTPTSVVLRWRTTLRAPSHAWWGPDPAALVQHVQRNMPATEHELVLDGLQPGTRYYYAVGTDLGHLAGADADHAFTTPPLAGAPAPLRAWVLGDSGTADANAARVRDAFHAAMRAEGRDADLVLMLGDNAYDSGTDAEYQAAVFEMHRETLRRLPLWPTLGNHDAISADSATQSGVYYDTFTLPQAGEAGGVPSGTEAWYSFDWGNVHFVCLDSQESDRAAGSLMLDWLGRDLAATSQDWIVAFWHHPPYTKGSHDSDTESRHVGMRENALPILEAGGVDLVLGGHSHSYERSMLVDGHYGTSDTFGPQHVIDGGDGRVGSGGAYSKPTPGLAPHEGSTHVVAGSSGQTSGGTLDHPVMVVGMRELGSVVLDVSGLRMDVRFLDDAGAWRDAFTIVKGARIETECADGVDDDADGATDCADADCAASLGDADGDTLTDCADCDPLSPANAPPSLVADVRAEKTPAGEALLTWTAPAGSAVVDVATGSLSALRGDRGVASATCLARAAVASVRDARDAPAPSDGWWYLARARNGCGASGWGTASDGTPRAITACD